MWLWTVTGCTTMWMNLFLTKSQISPMIFIVWQWRGFMALLPENSIYSIYFSNQTVMCWMWIIIELLQSGKCIHVTCNNVMTLFDRYCTLLDIYACILNHCHHKIILCPNKFHTTLPHSSSSVSIDLKVLKLVFCLLGRHLLPPACETWLVDKQTVAQWALCQHQFLTSLLSRLFPDFNHSTVTRNQSHNLGKMLNQHKSQLH